MLATLRNVALITIKEVLENDAKFHAEHGIFLEHLWQNADDSNEALFLFRIDNVDSTRKLIDSLHEAALKDDPNVNLPDIKYLE